MGHEIHGVLNRYGFLWWKQIVFRKLTEYVLMPLSEANQVTPMSCSIPSFAFPS